MFEKEATEYAIVGWDKSQDPRDVFTPRIDETKFNDWRNGAEFGYNKANEWQYVSEKGTPKTEGHYLVCLRNKNKDVFDCWIYYDKDVGWYSMKVRMKDIYAWKEIVPPKEIE